jgi:hypothetical protein
MAGIDTAAPDFRQGVDYLLKLGGSPTPPAYCKETAMISDTEAAYAAGILDGEGSIALTRNRKSRWPSPQVSVSSTDKELLVWLRSRFGGSIVIKKPRRSNHSVSYEWKLTDRRALGFLQTTQKHLVIERKASEAKLLLDSYLECTPRNGRYTREMAEKKLALIEQFASLP